jgi:periplasmic protein TonB
MLNQQSLLLKEANYGAIPKNGSVILPPARVTAQQNVFAEAMLETTSTRQKRHPLKWAVSLGAHIAVLTVLVLMPLYFSQGLDLQRFNMTLLTVPLPPAAAPPPPPPAIARAAREIPKTFTAGKLTAPSFVPKAIVTTPGDVAPPDVSVAGITGGVPGGMAGGQVGGVLGGLGPAAPVVEAAVSEGPKKPVQIGGKVKPPRLLAGPMPVYPVLAKQSHVQGIVVIEAIIDEHGNVIEQRVLSGHPLLVQAAMKAVSERKYEPTVLDGEATPVDLRVEITFHMG